MAPSLASDMTYQEAEALLRRMAETATAAPENGSSTLLPAQIEGVLSEEDAVAPRERSGVWKAARRYRALIEQIPVVTFMAAMDETIHELYVSPQIQSLLGFTQTEWLENPFLWYNQLHPDDRERWQNEFARTCTTGVQFKSEYRFIARDGRVVWVHGECELIRDENGEPLFLQGVAYDITESKRAQEALERIHRDLEAMVAQRTAALASANDALLREIAERQQAQQELARQATELARSNAELSQFAYVASHDLQEPLRMMASFSQLLAERYSNKLGADADEFIHFITDGAVRMQRLIDDLLIYSRAGRGEIPSEPVSLAKVLEVTCSNLRAAIEEKRASVTADTLPVVLGNQTQLLQLFQNLIANALKFTHGSKPARVHVGAKAAGKEWLISIKDNGIGFDPQYSDRIFLIFQRLHVRVEYPGTGMGLAICRKIVERHGGRIWAESEPDKGSTFYFTLPAVEGE